MDLAVAGSVPGGGWGFTKLGLDLVGSHIHLRVYFAPKTNNIAPNQRVQLKVYII